MIRLTSQHRALYCYLLLSVWLFLLLGGMYKYIGSEDTALSAGAKYPGNDFTTQSFSNYIHPDIKTRRVLKVCNQVKDIKPLTEGQVNGNYTLEGVIVLLRHGDRGPLNHVRNISNVNCAMINDPYYSAYESYIENVTSTPLLFQLLGPFHGFPLLPSSSCKLGQLTQVGVSQLLATGRALRKVYFDRLFMYNISSSDEIAVYSTRYRRTLQSGLAFLYSFLTPEFLHYVVLKESQSLQFCFDDCACPSVDVYTKKFTSETSSHLKSHPAVLKLVRSASAIVYEFYDKKLSVEPNSLRDALLTYVCHDSRLPCLESETSSPNICVRAEQVTGLFAYTEWEARQYSKSPSLKKACLLRSYGLIRNIVSHLLRIISEKKPKIVLYSGHDKTIQYLTAALGIISEATVSANYASRLIIEVYRSTERITVADQLPVGSDYFFRYMASSCKFVDLHYSFRLGISTIAEIIREVYYFIWHTFKDTCLPLPTREKMTTNC